MTRFWKRPLALMFAAEALLVAALAIAAWHVYQARTAPPAPAPPVALSDAGAAQPALPTLRPTPAGSPSPGHTASPGRSSPAASPPGLHLATGDSFLAHQGRTLNHDQAAWEAAEWTLLKTGVDAARAYIEGVVLPAVEQAEKRGGG